MLVATEEEEDEKEEEEEVTDLEAICLLFLELAAGVLGEAGGERED